MIIKSIIKNTFVIHHSLTSSATFAKLFLQLKIRKVDLVLHLECQVTKNVYVHVFNSTRNYFSLLEKLYMQSFNNNI